MELIGHGWGAGFEGGRKRAEHDPVAAYCPGCLDEMGWHTKVERDGVWTPPRCPDRLVSDTRWVPVSHGLQNQCTMKKATHIRPRLPTLSSQRTKGRRGGGNVTHTRAHGGYAVAPTKVVALPVLASAW